MDSITSTDRRYWLDMGERAIATAIQAFLAVWLASFIASGTIDLSALQAAGVAGLAAGFSVIKSGIAKFTGDPDSASLIPDVPVPPTQYPDEALEEEGTASIPPEDKSITPQEPVPAAAPDVSDTGPVQPQDPPQPEDPTAFHDSGEADGKA